MLQNHLSVYFLLGLTARNHSRDFGIVFYLLRFQNYFQNEKSLRLTQLKSIFQYLFLTNDMIIFNINQPC